MGNDVVHILPAEHLGEAVPVDGMLDIGGVKVPVWGHKAISIFVRRLSSDLSIAEIIMVRHDGLAQEQLDQENAEAERYPLGPKEYWRGKMVGKYTYGFDGHQMTDEDFEADWNEGEE